MRLEIAGLTDVGRARSQNEDALYLCGEEALFIVADGMGGHQSGQVASAMAVSQIREHYEATKANHDPDRQGERLVRAIELANGKIYEAASGDDQLRGMGTTIVGCRFEREGLHIAHVGDSRCYRIREADLEQLTEDHSLANEYLRAGILKPEQLATFPYRNVITRAVGLTASVEVAADFHAYRDGDVYLLCSDGLTDMVGENRIVHIIDDAESLQDACRELVDAANERGGHDNVTVVLVQVAE